MHSEKPLLHGHPQFFHKQIHDFPPVLQQVKDCSDCEDSPVTKEGLG